MRAQLEKILPSPVQTFHCGEFILPAFNCPFHFHPEIEITHIVASEGTRIVGDNVGRFVPGDLVILGADLPHSYMNSPEADAAPNRAHSQVIQFRRDSLGERFFDLPEMTTMHDLLARAARGLHFGPATLAQAIPFLEVLVANETPCRVIPLLQLLRCLATADDATQLASPGYRPSITHGDSERLDIVCAYINAHYSEPVDQEAVARRVGMSASTFSRFFKKRTRMTFSRFLNEVRISHACRLLLESDLTVLEISHQSGFGNLSNFNRRFREFRNLSPRAYRRALSVR